MIGGSSPSLPTKNTKNNKNYLEVSNFFVIFVNVKSSLKE
jgi:hypothetical protein